ncbi:LIC10183 family protein [Leptospira licerasiae]|uniref:DUF2004 domain-containing protein n=1 Tax=Leptospira licerasiae str. MMD4847 TaxID=1049971 RepID=A0ABN0HBG1_9LEPT|nr:hypothetical protein [Leptospira licerasiae]EIE02833.1 hypothetical protein LEP1GSC185_0935 [Leptospira licerasiae serovar Varillal str. VAR 010]EJZ43105.1 hypothetical protein LEP1GSC178_3614 [Leptospira licerasiae str. MMD4847]
MDLLTEEISGDLLLDSKTFDFATNESELDAVRSMVIEAFDMTLADDIDFPEFYSLQRKHLFEEDESGPQERLNDAYRILAQFPQIDQSTVEVSSLDKGIGISFRLKSGEELSISLGGT